MLWFDSEPGALNDLKQGPGTVCDCPIPRMSRLGWHVVWEHACNPFTASSTDQPSTPFPPHACLHKAILTFHQPQPQACKASGLLPLEWVNNAADARCIPVARQQNLGLLG